MVLLCSVGDEALAAIGRESPVARNVPFSLLSSGIIHLWRDFSG
jgi:hypothetical protein